MNLGIVESIKGVPIRLTDERWEHILEDHPYMSGFYEDMLSAVQNPEFILRGNKGAKIAVANLSRRRWILVMYRELGKKDGFIITAYIDSDFNKNEIIWKRQ
jgi:hypothetical protein